MKVEVVNNYRTDENAYIIYENTDAIVIDPGSKADEILEKVNLLGLEIKYIMITHCHYDHIIGLGELREKTGAKLVSSVKASENIQNPKTNLSAFSLDYIIQEQPSDIIIKDNETLNLCGMDVTALYTPGHTNCGTCYKIEDSVFVGDTLFLRSVGRTDLPTGNAGELETSVRTKLYTLPDTTAVYPGHGASTNIGYEKNFNFCISEN